MAVLVEYINLNYTPSLGFEQTFLLPLCCCYSSAGPTRPYAQSLTCTQRQIDSASCCLPPGRPGESSWLMNLPWKSFVNLHLATNKSNLDNCTCICMDMHVSSACLLPSYKCTLFHTYNHTCVAQQADGW